MTMILGGCGGEAPKPPKIPLPPMVEKPVVPAPVNNPPLSSSIMKVEPSQGFEYTYDPKGKSDPFKPLVVEKPAPPPPTAKKETVSEGATELERVDLAQIKLVAVFWGIRDPKGNVQAPKALVEAPGGKGYLLSMGTAIGKNKGKVSQITSAGVVVSERYEASPGKFKIRDIPLKFPE